MDNALCPKCAHPMEKREGMFYWRGDFRPGWVCIPCNSLHAIKNREIEPLKGDGI
jgi:hypothetical protein